MSVSEYFSKELDYIVDPLIRQIVAETLDKSPECIVHIPASSTGKFHPAYSLGEGGLMRHVKAAVGIAHSLIETEIFQNMVFQNMLWDAQLLRLYKDCAYAALIIHDCMKPDVDVPEHWTRFDHPILAAELFKETAREHITKDNMEYMKQVVPLVYKAVASHMGQWNTSSKSGGLVLPKPKTGLQHFVHLCDYLASRKYLAFDFDIYCEVAR